MNKTNSSQPGLSRRTFLRGTAATGGGIAAASFFEVFGLKNSALAQTSGDDVATIVNLAATAETLAVTFYYSVITAGQFDFAADDVAYLKLALDAEKYHLDFLNSAGGKSLADKFYVPADLLTNLDTMVQTALAAETAFIGAYLAATRRFAELGQPRLAATTAQHAVSEGQHLTLLRDIAGLTPNDLGLPAPIYYNVSDAVPTLTPFLTGGEGFVGPVSFPNNDQINAALGDVRTIRVPTFTQVY